MPIRIRLIFGFALLFVVMAIGAFSALGPVIQLSNISKETIGIVVERVEQVSNMGTHLAEHRQAELGYALSTDPTNATLYRALMDKHWQELQRSIEQYERMIDDPARRADYEAFLIHVNGYEAYLREFLALAEEGRRAEAQRLLASFENEVDGMMYLILRLRSQEKEVSSELGQAAQRSASRSWYLFLITTFFVGVVEVGLGWYIWRSLSGGFKGLLEGTHAVSQGDFSRPVPVRSRDEFGQLASSFNSMMTFLKESREENWRLNQEALKLREDHVRLLRESLAKIVGAQEEERQRVARELHDQAGQALTVLQLGLAQLERETDSPQVKEQAASLRTLTVETMEEIRNLALDLRPAALDELGLIPALQGLIRDFSERLGVPIELEVSGLERRLPSEVEVTLFRAIQEGLTNLAKHSRATRARVNLRADTTKLEVHVEDNGVGFNVAEVVGSPKQRSLGLFGIQERVNLLGGSSQVQSEPGKGTKLIISVPLVWEAAIKERRHGEDKSTSGG